MDVKTAFKVLEDHNSSSKRHAPLTVRGYVFSKTHSFRSSGIMVMFLKLGMPEGKSVIPVLFKSNLPNGLPTDIELGREIMITELNPTTVTKGLSQPCSILLASDKSTVVKCNGANTLIDRKELCISKNLGGGVFQSTNGERLVLSYLVHTSLDFTLVKDGSNVIVYNFHQLMINKVLYIVCCMKSYIHIIDQSESNVSAPLWDKAVFAVTQKYHLSVQTLVYIVEALLSKMEEAFTPTYLRSKDIPQLFWEVFTKPLKSGETLCYHRNRNVHEEFLHHDKCCSIGEDCLKQDFEMNKVIFIHQVMSTYEGHSMFDQRKVSVKYFKNEKNIKQVGLAYVTRAEGASFFLLEDNSSSMHCIFMKFTKKVEDAETIIFEACSKNINKESLVRCQREAMEFVGNLIRIEEMLAINFHEKRSARLEVPGDIDERLVVLVNIDACTMLKSLNVLERDMAELSIDPKDCNNFVEDDDVLLSVSSLKSSTENTLSQPLSVLGIVTEVSDNIKNGMIITIQDLSSKDLLHIQISIQSPLLKNCLLPGVIIICRNCTKTHGKASLLSKEVKLIAVAPYIIQEYISHLPIEAEPTANKTIAPTRRYLYDITMGGDGGQIFIIKGWFSGLQKLELKWQCSRCGHSSCVCGGEDSFFNSQNQGVLTVKARFLVDDGTGVGMVWCYDQGTFIKLLGLTTLDWKTLEESVCTENGYIAVDFSKEPGSSASSTLQTFIRYCIHPCVQRDITLHCVVMHGSKQVQESRGNGMLLTRPILRCIAYLG